jgi:hypothetical protein
MEKYAIENLVAVTSDTNAAILGYLTWYSIRNGLYEINALRALVLQAGLEESCLPPKIRVSDAFRRATRALEQRRDVGNGVYLNYMVRDVVNNRKTIQRNLVKEVVDKKNQKLAHRSSEAILIFDKQTESISVQAHNQDTQTIADEAIRLFQVYQSHFDGQAVRRMVAGVISSMSPVPVRPTGGVYFIPHKYQDRLATLIRFLRSLDEGEGQRIPLVNDEENRNMLVQKLKYYLKDTLHSLSLGLKDEMPKKQAKEHLDNATKVLRDFKEYQEMLREETEDMREITSLIKRQMVSLLDKVSDESKK